MKAVSRATRSPGKYTVVWDGKDDAGKALPQGTYTIGAPVEKTHLGPCAMPLMPAPSNKMFGRSR